jgi:uncharacterized membrane protein YfcA
MHDIIIFLVGIVVGAMNAIAGGGMLIGFPVLLGVGGLSAISANATTGLVILPGNIASTWAYRKYLHRIPRQYALLLFPAIVGGIIGATLLRHTSSASFERLIPGLILFAVFLFAFQPFLHHHILNHIHGPKRVRKRVKPILWISLAVLPIAIYGGYFGAGFGFIMLSFLGFTRLHDHIHRMNALKNITAICLATTALIVLHGSGLINWRYGVVMAGGNLIGGYVGAVGAQKVSGHAIRIIVIVIGVSTAVYLGLRSY